MPRRAVLTYDGTRLHRGGAHVIRATSAESGGEALEQFRVKWTDAATPSMVRMDLTNAPQHKTFVAMAHALCTEKLGAPTANFAERTGGTSNWFVERSQLPSALRILDVLQPIPIVDLVGILAVTYKIEFRFLALNSRLPLPFQRRDDYLNAEADYYRFLGHSFLEAQFSAHSIISAFFSLPFEDWTDEVARYVRTLQGELPFKISDKRWKRWHLNRSGSGYAGRRISVSWKAQTV